jgi:hypothetical protein
MLSHTVYALARLIVVTLYILRCIHFAARRKGPINSRAGSVSDHTGRTLIRLGLRRIVLDGPALALSYSGVHHYDRAKQKTSVHLGAWIKARRCSDGPDHKGFCLHGAGREPRFNKPATRSTMRTWSRPVALSSPTDPVERGRVCCTPFFAHGLHGTSNRMRQAIGADARASNHRCRYKVDTVMLDYVGQPQFYPTDNGTCRIF